MSLSTNICKCFLKFDPAHVDTALVFQFTQNAFIKFCDPSLKISFKNSFEI